MNNELQQRPQLQQCKLIFDTLSSGLILYKITVAATSLASDTIMWRSGTVQVEKWNDDGLQ